MRANVKPLTHWVIYKQYKVRFKERSPQIVTGILTMPEGEVAFLYEPANMVIYLPNARITINEYGWELERQPGDEGMRG